MNVVSCVNGYGARILQAHYQEEKLVVYKSRYYDFGDAEERYRNTRLFLLYLASEPVGNTGIDDQLRG